MGDLTQKRLCEILTYCPNTGVFMWRERPECRRTWNTKHANKRAGDIWRPRGSRKSYVRIGINNRKYLAHRLAWLYMRGVFPPKGIDHEDGDGLNNRWANLRAANQQQNGANRGANSNNRCGFKGVHFHRATGKYRARINVNGQSHDLGLFITPEAAHAVYLSAAKKYFGDFARID